MGRRLYLLDFDRTLFDTARFQQDLAEILSPEDPDAFTKEILKFTDERTGLYDIYEQATHHTGLSKSQVMELFAKHIPDDDYCFPDVPAWIRSHEESGASIAIITVGGPDYQALKFERAPSLDGIPKHLINDSKSALLDDELGDQKPPYHISYMPGDFDEIWLVDDRPDHLSGLSHLGHVKPIRIIRPGDKRSNIPTPDDIKDVIVSFGELE